MIFFKQKRDVYTESKRNFLNIKQSDIFFCALDHADVCAMKIRFFRQFFLRKTLTNALFPNALAKFNENFLLHR